MNCKHNMNIKNGLLERRLVNTYKAGQTQYLDVLLSSEDIIDFISKYYYIGKMIEYDESLIDSVASEKKEVEETKEQLEKSRQNLKTCKDNQKKIEILLENAKVVRNSYINQLTEE